MKMRFRAGLVIGFATGYVLGAKAGRERYEQIRRAYLRVRADDRVQEMIDQGRQAAEIPADKVRGAMSDKIQNVSDFVREKAEG